MGNKRELGEGGGGEGEMGWRGEEERNKSKEAK